MSRSDEFVDYLFKICSRDKGFRADLRRADNPAFEWRIWPVINRFAGSLESDDIRKAYAIIGSAIGKSGQSRNGNIGIGKAFRFISKGDAGKFPKGDAGKFPPRFMRLLSSNDLSDLLMVLRPVLSYISSEDIALDYKGLLKSILGFRYEESRNRIKACWAADYLNVEEDGNNG